MPPAKEKRGKADPLLVATESFSADVDGVPTSVHKGVTRVRASHPLVKQNPHYFEPVSDSPTLGTETATVEL